MEECYYRDFVVITSIEGAVLNRKYPIVYTSSFHYYSVMN